MPDNSPSFSGSKVTPFAGVLYQAWPRDDGSLKIEFLSEGAEDYLEVTAEELARAIMAQQVPLVDTDPAEFYRAGFQGMAQRRSWSAEFGYRGPKSGTVRWFRGQDFPHQTPEGTLYFSGVLIDITELKEAQQRTRQADRILADHMENTPLAVIEWDAQFGLIRWSGQAEAIFGWKAEEVMGKFPHEWRFVHDDDLPRVSEVIRQLMTSEQPRNICRNRNYHKSGRVLYCEWHNSVVFDDLGRVSSILSLTQDLTEAQAAQTELRRSEDRLLTVLRFASMLGWEHNFQDSRTYYSQDFGTFYGMTNYPAQPTTQEELAVIHPDDQVRIRDLIADAVRRGGELRAEFRGAMLDADGQTRWYLLQGQVVCDEQGVPRSIVGVTADISHQKRATEERHLLDRQLMEARRYESLGVLAGGVAHDFNNLLTVVLGNAALLKSEFRDVPQLLPALQAIEGASQRAAELCRQLTAYAGSGRFFMTTADLSQLVREARVAIGTATRRANPVLELAESLPPVRLEPQQFRQVVINLVTNAMEAYPDGTGTIRITTQLQKVTEQNRRDYLLNPTPGNYVSLVVSDHGQGIPSSQLASVFDPFFSTKFAGRGLGLAAVLGIARGHRGGVRVRSEVGRGTIVEVLWPALASLDSADTEGVSSPVELSSSPSTTAIPRRRTLLIADDEPNIRDFLISVLEEAGYKIVEAEDGPSALEAFQAADPPVDLAIVDMLMPGISGTETIRRMRSQQNGLPAILITGFVDRELENGLCKGGPTQLLVKPFRIEQLLKSVSQSLAPSSKPSA